jgi:hypothetical protein
MQDAENRVIRERRIHPLDLGSAEASDLVSTFAHRTAIDHPARSETASGQSTV